MYVFIYLINKKEIRFYVFRLSPISSHTHAHKHDIIQLTMWYMFIKYPDPTNYGDVFCYNNDTYTSLRYIGFFVFVSFLSASPYIPPSHECLYSIEVSTTIESNIFFIVFCFLLF
jgi:hypothetical protein